MDKKWLCRWCFLQSPLHHVPVPDPLHLLGEGTLHLLAGYLLVDHLPHELDAEPHLQDDGDQGHRLDEGQGHQYEGQGLQYESQGLLHEGQGHQEGHHEDRLYGGSLLQGRSLRADRDLNRSLQHEGGLTSVPCNTHNYHC